MHKILLKRTNEEKYNRSRYAALLIMRIPTPKSNEIRDETRTKIRTLTDFWFNASAADPTLKRKVMLPSSISTEAIIKITL